MTASRPYGCRDEEDGAADMSVVCAVRADRVTTSRQLSRARR